jgi:tRNA A37 methylthiotransferase MiaB
VEVLVDTVVPPRNHDHEDRPAPRTGDGLSGRTRGNKLVHLRGGPELLGTFVNVRVEHAGPYALRGSVAAS